VTTERYAWKEIPGSSHALLRERILELPAGRRLLDLGAAGGHLGRAVRGRCAYLAGVEPDPALPPDCREGYDDWRSTDALSAVDVICVAVASVRLMMRTSTLVQIGRSRTASISVRHPSLVRAIT